MRGRLCLVTGATGYVGGRLVPSLLDAGYRVRCMTRSAWRLRDQPWVGQVEIREADALDPVATGQALTGVDIAYYLVHSLGSGDFEEADRRAAGNFATAAREAGVRRLVYLGGLIPDEELSAHLRSRTEVGDILLASGVPTAWLRAAMIVGSGSVSFEMLRYLTERLPVMVAPRWVHTRIQPIAITDVLHYLVRSAELPASVSRGFDIGGRDVLTYANMMRQYATVRRLPPRRIVPVPVLSPGLSSLWVGVVTPVPGDIARPLVESLRNEVVCAEQDLVALVGPPPDGPTGFRQAVTLALRRVRDVRGAAHWPWAGPETPGGPSDPLPTDPPWSGGSLYADDRARLVEAPPEHLWAAIERITEMLHWQVEEVEPGRLLRLRTVTRIPGLAWLELGIRREGSRTRYIQRALFHPHGLAGHASWLLSWPLHRLVLGGLCHRVARAAEHVGFPRRPGPKPV